VASQGEAPKPPGSLRKHNWQRFLKGPDPELVNKLYTPALSESQRYDRCCAYFSSSVLAAAARGFAPLISRLISLGDQIAKPAIRLVVNEELNADDVRAMIESGDLSALEELLLARFKPPKELLEKDRLGMLAWLVKAGLLEVRVGVMRQGQGIVHAKFGIATDEAGDSIVFAGSGNESAAGLRANYERLEISTSWGDPDRYQEYAREFELLWDDHHPDVHTELLPEAVKLRIVKFAPPEPPLIEPSTALARQRAAMTWQFITESPFFSNGETSCDATSMVDLWPHQRRVVDETANAWPAGRLLCDEVGMGKTIEAILILLRLIAGRGVKRALLLLPKGILKQWQGELREKGGLVVPRLEGTSTLIWPDEKTDKVESFAEALKTDILLVSREMARTEANLATLLASDPWDLVLLDEAHAARRREQEEGEFNSGTLLLNLLRELQLRRRARGFLLLSATPMQTQPWEPWDLLSVLGEGGLWLADFSGVRGYYEALSELKHGHCDLPTAKKAATLIAQDRSFPKPPTNTVNLREVDSVARKLVFAPPRQRDELAGWLRSASPLARRMHRNTRKTLAKYFEKGLLADRPARRFVDDIQFDYVDLEERKIYNDLERYINRRYEELEQEKPGKGFVMTVYRRRASSSPFALEKSLERRQSGLLSAIDKRAFDFDLELGDVPEALEAEDLPEGLEGGKISSALPQDPKVAQAELKELRPLLDRLRGLNGRDSKRDAFFGQLRRLIDDGRAVLVFTEYSDTLEYLRDSLSTHYGKTLGCYSGEGGQLFDGEKWATVSKDAITRALREGRLRVLLCTDAASEGLNLQAAAALINYDLPWNPSRVEQRIGRIDRIGQKHEEIYVVNLFLKDSVDDRVYRALRERCGLFETFVGAMQPVLAKARRMLMGQDPVDPSMLRRTASEVESDPLAEETYIDSEAAQTPESQPAISREELLRELKNLTGEFGPKVRDRKGGSGFELTLSGSIRFAISNHLEVLEKDKSVIPLTPISEPIRELVQNLQRPGERLPLVLGAVQSGPFRRSIAFWIDGHKLFHVQKLSELLTFLEGWDGSYPLSDVWNEGLEKAQSTAADEVKLMTSRAQELERVGMASQMEAARIRLIREMGRFLVSLGGTSDFDKALREQASRDSATALRLRECIAKLGGYPEWTPELVRELREFEAGLTENKRRGRLGGREVEAALQDPRWIAAMSSKGHGDPI
jgi:SNF2 family DNA or RNA helicase